MQSFNPGNRDTRGLLHPLVICLALLGTALLLLWDQAQAMPPDSGHGPGRRIHPPGPTASHHREGPGPLSVQEVRDLLEQAGGTIESLPNGFFSLQWFPADWKSRKEKRIIVTLHGSGGHAERMFHLWYRNRQAHDCAIIAPQYARGGEGQGSMRFEDSPAIYDQLRIIVQRLRQENKADDHTVLVLHGFSRGAARVFELAALDRAPDGMRAFSAFIADSGTTMAENHGQLSPMLRRLSSTAYDGARFWLYCATGDHGGRTCQGMRRMQAFITSHGGQVDDLCVFESDRHGLLITGGPRKRSTALDRLFSYIGDLSLHR